MAVSTLTRRDALRLAAAASVPAVGGCLGGETGADTPTGTGDPGSPRAAAEVTAHSRPYPEFEPQVIHLQESGTVEWIVETGRHDVTGYHRAEHPPHRTPPGRDPWGSDRLSTAGASYERQFDHVGVYDYVDTQQVCTSHEIAGNVGRIVVGWPDPESEPALAPPQSELPGAVQAAIEQFNEQTIPVLKAGP